MATARQLNGSAGANRRQRYRARCFDKRSHTSIRTEMLVAMGSFRGRFGDAFWRSGLGTLFRWSLFSDLFRRPVLAQPLADTVASRQTSGPQGHARCFLRRRPPRLEDRPWRCESILGAGVPWGHTWSMRCSGARCTRVFNRGQTHPQRFPELGTSAASADRARRRRLFERLRGDVDAVADTCGDVPRMCRRRRNCWRRPSDRTCSSQAARSTRCPR
jgi:hypothetical protein